MISQCTGWLPVSISLYSLCCWFWGGGGKHVDSASVDPAVTPCRLPGQNGHPAVMDRKGGAPIPMCWGGGVG